MCTITAQLDELIKNLEPQAKINDQGKAETYYQVEYDTALLFGLAEFGASVVWEEDVSCFLLKSLMSWCN